MYDIQLAQSLEGHFKSGDQFNLNVVVKDSQYSYRIEAYGRIGEPRSSGADETEVGTSKVNIFNKFPLFSRISLQTWLA